MKNLNVRLKFAALFMVGLVVGSGLMYVLAQSQAATFWISSGVYPGAPSYTIWSEGSTYFAKNAYGKIQYSGTNASQIFNSVGQNVGSIFVKAGTYSLTNGWILGLNDSSTIGSNLFIYGEGAASILKWNNAVGKALVYARQKSNITIENLAFDGSKASVSSGNGASAIRFQGVTDFILDTLWISNTYHQGIDLVDYNNIAFTKRGIINNIITFQTGSAGLYVGYRSNTLTISNSIFRDAGYGTGGSGIDRDGLILAGEAYGYVANITLTNIQAIHNFRHGVSFWDVENTTGNTIIANSNGQQGIYFSWGNHHINLRGVEADYNTYSGVYFDNGNVDAVHNVLNDDITIQGKALRNGYEGVKIISSLPGITGPLSKHIDISVDAIENQRTGIGVVGYSASYKVMYVNIHDCLIANNSLAGSGSYNGILLYQAEYVEVSNVEIEGSLQAWGIYENSASGGYNTISNVNAWTYVTGGIYRSQATTHVTDSYNGTSWVANSP